MGGVAESTREEQRHVASSSYLFTLHLHV